MRVAEDVGEVSGRRARGPAALDGIRGAISLLTRLPSRSSGAVGASWFPLIGGLIGLLGAAPVLLIGSMEPVLGAIGGIAVIALVSGFLHLDGLADTTDALLVVDRERAETARQDPAIGAGGAAALVLVLGIQAAALASIGSSLGPRGAAAALVAAVIASRAMPVLAPHVTAAVLDRGVAASVARSGLAGWFVASIRRRDEVIAVGLAIALVGVVAALVGRSGGDAVMIALGAGAGALAGLATWAAVVRARGQLDGDGIGAGIELTMTAVLVATAVFG
jgi:adenosylcobinamide-GDP ribazoletransferase